MRDLLIDKGITDPSAVKTWFCFVLIAKTLFALFSVGMAIGLAMLLFSRKKKDGCSLKLSGLSVIGVINTVIQWIWYALAAVAAVVFVYKFITYSIKIISEEQEFVYPLVAMVTGEIVMLLAAAGVVVLFVKFSGEMSDLAYQLYYMLVSGKTENHVPSVTYIILFSLSAFCCYLVYFFCYDLITSACFATIALALLFLGICVKILKNKVERIKYENYKLKKE